MKYCLGIDTSNYRTSVGLVKERTIAGNYTKMIPVAKGSVGIRQSDAVFHHTKQLLPLLEEAFSEHRDIKAIGVSTRPRPVAGSYMPCFLAGEAAASTAAAALGVPLYRFSHQCGHLAAAIASSGREDFYTRRFGAFHVSGGTTEAVLVTPGGERLFTAARAAASLDLKAGQAVDRCGLLLGLPFPCGPALEQLALQWEESVRVHPVLRGADCSLSGLENQCRQLKEKGAPKEMIAR